MGARKTFEHHLPEDGSVKRGAVTVFAMLVSLSIVSACNLPPNESGTAGKSSDEGEGLLSTSAIRDSAKAPDGVEIIYEIAGVRERALVFVHGWSCDRSYWREQFDYFSKQHRVVSIDLAGHGESGQERTDWSMSAFGADVRAVVEKAGLGKVVLVGHSMGGPVVVEAARLMPEQTAAVIPVDYFQAVNDPMTSERIDAFVAPLVEDFAADTYSLAKSFFGPHADTDRAERVARDMASAPPEVAIPAVRATFAYDAAAGLGAVDAPIWIINADLWATDLAALREHNEKIRLAVVPGAGHFVMMDYPEEFNGLLSRAVQETTGGRLP